MYRNVELQYNVSNLLNRIQVRFLFDLYMYDRSIPSFDTPGLAHRNRMIPNRFLFYRYSTALGSLSFDIRKTSTPPTDG